MPWTSSIGPARLRCNFRDPQLSNSNLRKGSAVIGISADYDIDRHLTPGITTDNAAHETCRVSTGSSATYGHPRTFMVTPRGCC